MALYRTFDSRFHEETGQSIRLLQCQHRRSLSPFDDVSGAANSCSSMPLIATKDDFTKTIVEENVLEKPTLSSRKKSLRHLTELYGMDPSETLFRVLWELGHADLDSLPSSAWSVHMPATCNYATVLSWFVHCAWARFLTDQAWSSISKVDSLVASVLL